jgi:hypothetical protein
MRASTEISIDLTAQELLSLPEPIAAGASPAPPADCSIVEIELTAEQMDELLTCSACRDTGASSR